ncbi:hypothetical protein FSP39_021606 [Pinctada imbricata]|uniref:DNA-directed primase/polymerase protein n=1 Tax=Pinctada imbricata TaxID=66713 RepID=A0AA88XU25_PINIB|nr:hypothetical protein FSP39_021606 [Pinctada imbricata]
MARLRQRCQKSKLQNGRRSNSDQAQLEERNLTSMDANDSGMDRQWSADDVNNIKGGDLGKDKDGDLGKDRINSHQKANGDTGKEERQPKCDSSHNEVCERFTEEELLSLIVKNKNMEDTMFCDLGVYTKNRNFRLYKSCKYGKNNPLVLADQNKYVARSPRTARRKNVDSEEQLFLDSLIANIKFSPDMRVLTFGESGTSSHYSRNSHRKRESNQDNLGGYHLSPYPEVDHHILCELDKRGPKACIRQWTYFSNGEMILFEIGGNRWCANIGRCHKSNNIM